MTNLGKWIFITFLGIIFLNAKSSASEASPSAEEINSQAYQLFQKGAYRESYQLSLNAKSQSLIENNFRELARALSNQASNLHYFGENERALRLYTESLQIAEENKDTVGILRALGNTSGVLAQIGKTEDELKLRIRQFEVAQNFDDPNKFLSAAIGMSQVHSSLSNLQQSQKYLNIAKQALESLDSPFLGIFLLFAESDIYESQDKPLEAISALNEALKLAQTNQFKGLVASTYANLAEIYLKLEEISKAEQFAKKGLKLSKQLSHKYKQYQNIKLLTQISEIENDHKQALAYERLAGSLQESIQGERIKMLAEFTKIDREIRETEEELALSQQRQKIAELKLASQQQLQVIWGAVFLVSAALIMFWFYRRSTRLELSRQRRLNQELKQLDQVKDRILTNTSHELRTPINGIVGLSQIVLMENQDTLDSESIQHIQLIEKSGMQLSEIVDDILDLAKLKTHIIAFKQIGRAHV